MNIYIYIHIGICLDRVCKDEIHAFNHLKLFRSPCSPPQTCDLMKESASPSLAEVLSQDPNPKCSILPVSRALFDPISLANSSECPRAPNASIFLTPMTKTGVAVTPILEYLRGAFAVSLETLPAQLPANTWLGSMLQRGNKPKTQHER